MGRQPQTRGPASLRPAEGRAQRRAERPVGPDAPRPRYGRIGAAALAFLVTLVAVLGAVGVLPIEPTPRAAAQMRPPEEGPGASGHGTIALSGAPAAGSPAAKSPDAEPETEPGAGGEAGASDGAGKAPDVPAHSGEGRRVVFDMGAQRVWLVDVRDGADLVRRTYLVSGSLTDNLEPGTYSVYSKSRHAVGVDDSGTMEYMVRFARGDRAAIGFHDIPMLDGVAVQSRTALGTPQSHGCIRQWRPDARALWEFAPVGTTVVVLA